MMSTKKRFSQYIYPFWGLFWLFIATGCTPAANESTLTDAIEVVATATTEIESTPTIVIEATTTPTATIEPTPSPTSTVAATPTLPPNSIIALPDEFKVIMDAPVCPRACYLGLTPGQTKDEVLTIIQALDVENIETKDEVDPVEGTTGIGWQWKERLFPFIMRHDAWVTFRDGHSILFGLPPRDLVPISLILEEFGEPDYMYIRGDGAGLWGFVLIYLYHDSIVKFSASGLQLSRPTALSANTLLQWIVIEEADHFFNWVCEGGWEIKFQEWKGYGGLDVYYDQRGNLLDEISIVDCADYEQ